MTVIEAKELSKRYGTGKAAIEGLSLDVESGEIFGFLGPNGAGKTTTIKMLLGFMPPSSGTLRVCGVDPLDPRSRTRIGFMPEVPTYYEYLRADELLAFYGRLSGMGGRGLRDRVGAVLEQVGLEGHGRKLIQHFSKGMKQRVGLGQAILHDPDLLILDEPLTGLDPVARMQIRDLILGLQQRGKTIFFSSHELSEAEMICTRVGVLKSGKLCFCGKTRDLAGDGGRNLERIFLDLVRKDDAVPGGHAR